RGSVPYLTSFPSTQEFSDTSAFFARIALDLHRTVPNSTYLADATAILQVFKNRLTPYTGQSLIWDQGIAWNGSSFTSAPDTSHANRFPHMALDAYDAGVVITSGDVNGLAHLLINVIWDGSMTSPQFANFIDGTNGLAFGRSAWGNGQVYSGWVLLAG